MLVLHAVMATDSFAEWLKSPVLLFSILFYFNPEPEFPLQSRHKGVFAPFRVCHLTAMWKQRAVPQQYCVLCLNLDSERHFPL